MLSTTKGISHLEKVDNVANLWQEMQHFHRITEWIGLGRNVVPNPHAMSRDTFYQTSLALSIFQGL